jgi:Ran GTPase-activating protein (RanGAP) involved in mRNA processing and transport
LFVFFPALAFSGSNIFRLFNTYFSCDIACLLVNVLKKNHTLNSLELPGTLLLSEAKGTTAVLDLIAESTSLTKLDISQSNNYDYARTASILGVNSFLFFFFFFLVLLPILLSHSSEALKSSQYIADLNLSYCDVGSNVQSLDALKDYFQTNHALEHIKLDSCGLYDLTAVSNAILANPMLNLRSLTLNNNYLTDFRPVYKLLLRENYSVISVLSLQACNLNPNSMELLCHALASNKRLTKLNISQNPIGDVGAEKLANMLTENSTLTHLNIGRNSILDQGAYHLARVFGVLHADDADLEVKSKLDAFDYKTYSPIQQTNYYAYNTLNTASVTPLTKVTHEAQLVYLSKYHQNKSISVLNIERNLLSKEAQMAFRKVMEKHQKVHVDLAYCDNPNVEENCCIS